jgi:hypothetical protein
MKLQLKRNHNKKREIRKILLFVFVDSSQDTLNIEELKLREIRLILKSFTRLI